MLVEVLVWNTKRKLRGLGRTDWADSLKTSINEDWEQK